MENQAVEGARPPVYRDPKYNWDLYLLGEELPDLENAFRLWRFGPVTTVERIIGFTRRTRSISGVSYLRKMLDVVLFPELWKLRTDLGVKSGCSSYESVVNSCAFYSARGLRCNASRLAQSLHQLPTLPANPDQCARNDLAAPGPTTPSGLTVCIAVEMVTHSIWFARRFEAY